MPVVLLQKDGAQDFLESFPVGEHILGRGNKLQCTCKKVSRKHGLLKVTNDEGISLKSTHNNPVFYRTQEAKAISLLTFGNIIKLNHNDKIALSLDHGWFTVYIKDNNEQNDITNKSTLNNDTANTTSDETILSHCLKRNITETENDPAAKKPKTDETNNLIAPDEIKSEPVDAPSTSSNNSVKEIEIKEEPVDNIPEIKQEPPVDNIPEIKQEPVEDSNIEVKSESLEKESKDTEVKSECQDEDDKNSDKPSTSGTNKRPWRDRCWYGSACYRKNGAHRVEFKHPGDSDFDSDSEDTRPICCYGAGCYRKNREHRKRYRHPGQTKLGDKPAPLPPKRRTVRPPVNPLDQDSEELDDYDYSDPFIDDGSEDEYEPSQETDTESDYEDSQEADEDQKRLLKEAKRFTRGKK